MNERSIFIEALAKQTPAQRSAYLDEACGRDAVLRRRVEGLLASHEQAGSFLAKPVPLRLAEGRAMPARGAETQEESPGDGADQSFTPGTLTTLDESPLPERPGAAVGPYRLLQPIGEGGMGVVYVAEQQHPVQRRVALKVIKAGMDSKAVLARFDAERQALALMDHPNIARVLDAGATEGGRPYFVMELVKGVPITKYCDDHGLTPRERLELFVGVCSAVQHAHQKGVIHRDLKPSNVLVASYDDRPVPKVIDFGVAKSTGHKLTERTMFTEFGQVVGTLEYMSPEQASFNGLDVDTRSDVYSLGVLLYELLAGSTPFEKTRLHEMAFDEVLRIIREEEPPRPSARLSTAQELPSIAARRKTEPRKLGQLVRGDLDWIVMKALEKDRARRYETANALVMDVQRYLNDEPVLACPPSALYRLRKFGRRNRAALLMAAVIGLAVLLGGGGWLWQTLKESARLAVTGEALNEALDQADRPIRDGRWPQALAPAERARGLIAGGGSPDQRRRVRALLADLKMAAKVEDVRLQQAAVKDDYFDILGADADYAEAFRAYGIDVEALAAQDAGERMRGRGIAAVLAAAVDHWAAVRRGAGKPGDQSWKHLSAVARAADPDPWRDQLRDALERRDRKVLEALAASDGVLDLPVATLVLLGDVLDQLQAVGPAEALLRKAQRRHPGDFWINHNLAEVLSRSRSAQPDEAVRFFTVALALRPQNPSAHNNLGVALRAQGKLAEAEAAYRAAVKLKPDLAGVHTNLGAAFHAQGKLAEAVEAHRTAVKVKPDFAGAHTNLGLALRDLGKLAEAEASCRAAVKIKPDYAEAHFNLGTVLHAQRKHAEAEASCRTAVKIKPDLAEAHTYLGRALEAQGKLAEAKAAYRAAIKIKPDLAEIHTNLGAALHTQGKHAEAEAAYRTAINLKPDLAEAHFNLGVALRAQGKLAEAIEAHRAAIKFKPDFADAHTNLGSALVAQGKPAEGEASCRAAVKIKPDYAEAHFNLGNALHTQRKHAEAEAAYRTAIKINPDLAEAHCNLGAALGSQGKPAEAEAACRAAVKIKPDYAEAHFNLGIALEAQGKPAEAAYRAAVKIKPDYAEAHCSLGHALRQQGHFADALASLRRGHELGSKNPHWRYPSAQWVREAERLADLDARLPAILAGKARPAGAAEGIAFAWFCGQHKALYAAAARLYAEAIADQPQVADDPRSGCRFAAACAAALAGCGEGKDAAGLGGAKRALLRGQALAWLRADLAAWRLRLEKDPDKDGPTVLMLMQHWQGNGCFAGVRGAKTLGRLPEAERPAWQKLWQEVAALEKRAAPK